MFRLLLLYVLYQFFVFLTSSLCSLFVFCVILRCFPVFITLGIVTYNFSQNSVSVCFLSKVYPRCFLHSTSALAFRSNRNHSSVHNRNVLFLCTRNKRNRRKTEFKLYRQHKFRLKEHNIETVRSGAVWIFAVPPSS